MLHNLSNYLIGGERMYCLNSQSHWSADNVKKRIFLDYSFCNLRNLMNSDTVVQYLMRQSVKILNPKCKKWHLTRLSFSNLRNVMNSYTCVQDLIRQSVKILFPYMGIALPYKVCVIDAEGTQLMPRGINSVPS